LCANPTFEYISKIYLFLIGLRILKYHATEKVENKCLTCLCAYGKSQVGASLLSYFKSVCNTEENKGLPSFLLGESMGGMVAFCMHFQDPKAWDGYIFLAPLLVMPGPMRPTWLQRTGFSLIKPFVSSWPIFPENHIVRKAIRSPAKQKLIAANPRRYTGNSRTFK
jgi:alpha-beta hydrolase superfamily lysophospholipase